jgi:hypothetical protein
MGAQKNRNR